MNATKKVTSPETAQINQRDNQEEEDPTLSVTTVMAMVISPEIVPNKELKEKENQETTIMAPNAITVNSPAIWPETVPKRLPKRNVMAAKKLVTSPETVLMETERRRLNATNVTKRDILLRNVHPLIDQ